MRRLALIVSAGVLLTTANHARAQAVVGGPAVGAYRVGDYFAAPGLYGTSYGFASYGVPRTYTSYSALPWSSQPSSIPGYGFLPGRYGVGPLRDLVLPRQRRGMRGLPCAHIANVRLQRGHAHRYLEKLSVLGREAAGEASVHGRAIERADGRKRTREVRVGQQGTHRSEQLATHRFHSAQWRR